MLAKIPKAIIFTECGQCGLVKLKNRWVEFDPKKIIENQVKFSRSMTKWEFEPVKSKQVLITVFGEEDGLPKKEEYTLPWKPNKITCTNCGRITGGYYEARIQLRGHLDGMIIESVHLMLDKMREKNRMAFYREETAKGGIDFLIGDRKAAKQIAKQLEYKGAEVKVSFQLFGRKDGVDIKRMTYSIRLKKPEVTGVI